MNDLRRELAPITDEAWEEIEEEARQALELDLAARKVVDFEGPLGWEASSISLGRTRALDVAIHEGVRAEARQVLPLVELRADFTLQRVELDAVARGAKDPDLDPVRKAAQRIARAEDTLAFYGYGPACMKGLVEATPHAPITLSTDYLAYAQSVVKALAALRRAAVGGPYALALGPRCYAGLTETLAPGGYPVYQHVKQLIEGPLIWAPAVDGAVLLSLRGGDFELTVGRDLSIGYDSHDGEVVNLYLEESVAFRVITPEAAVSLRYADSSKRAPGFAGS